MYGVSIMQAHIYVEKHIIKHAISLNYMQVIVNQNSLWTDILIGSNETGDTCWTGSDNITGNN